MQFPPWADSPKLKKADRASGRLNHLIYMQAMQHTGRGSARAFADFVGYENSTISLYIKRGAFSEKAAKAIADKIKIPATWLTDPLSIPNT